MTYSGHGTRLEAIDFARELAVAHGMATIVLLRHDGDFAGTYQLTSTAPGWDVAWPDATVEGGVDDRGVYCPVGPEVSPQDIVRWTRRVTSGDHDLGRMWTDAYPLRGRLH